MRWKPTGKHLFVAVAAFFIGTAFVELVTWPTQSAVTPPALEIYFVREYECTADGVTYGDPLREELRLRRELDEIAADRKKAKTDSERSLLELREITVRRLIELYQQGEIERWESLRSDGTTKLVYREVCYEK